MGETTPATPVENLSEIEIKSNTSAWAIEERALTMFKEMAE